MEAADDGAAKRGCYERGRRDIGLWPVQAQRGKGVGEASVG